MAHSPYFCAPFSRDVRHMYTVYVVYTCIRYMHQISQVYFHRCHFQVFNIDAIILRLAEIFCAYASTTSARAKKKVKKNEKKCVSERK